MSGTSPNYKQIYIDIIDKTFPQKKEECDKILSKTRISTIDVIVLNKIICLSVKLPV